MKHLLLLLSLITVIACTKAASAEEPEAFVERYITEVHSGVDHATYSGFWRSRTQKYLHNTKEGLKIEHKNSAKMHSLFLESGGFDTPVSINDWGDGDNTISYTYTLNAAVPNEVMMEHFGQGPANYNEYQITVEKEDGDWVVSGESIVGSF
jgi:hypothetical protein